MERWKRRAPSSASYSSLSSSESESESAPLPPRKFPSKPSKCANSQFTNPNPNHNPEPAVVNNPVARRIKSLEPEEDDSFDPSSVLGTCPFMCPDGERIQRERLRDLAAFERLNGNPGKSSPTLAVKKFCRTISTKNMQLSDVRPLPVLERTLEYLLYLLDSKEHPFEVVHDFIFDRTRSIRQDLSIQNVVNDRAIFLYEEMVKFHIISLHKLQSCSGAPNSSSMHYLNMEQLTKALKSLYDLYEENRNSSSFYTNEAEFRSFYVFLHLCPNSQPMGESLFTWLHNMPSFIIKSKEVSFARTVLRFFRMGNYKRFLSIAAAESSLLQYYILEPHISEVRRLALTCINHGSYKLHPYPLVHLSKLLMMEESDVESLCNSCGLETSMDEFGNKFLPTKQSSFCHSKGQVKIYPLLGLEHMER